MESTRPSLLSLPLEILDKIIECNVISYVELCKLSCASRIFHPLTNSNRIWMIKYKQMWPKLADLFDLKTDWKYQFRQRIDYKVKIQACLKKLSFTFHSRTLIHFGYQQIERISRYHPLGWNIIKDEFLSIMNDPDKFHNLNLKYCAKMVFWERRHKILKEGWREFLSCNAPNNIILYEGAYLISRWLQPAQINCLNDVDFQIGSLAQRVFQEVKRRLPSHPLMKRGVLPPGDVMRISCYSPPECRIILCCINIVMFEQMKFSGYGIFQSADDILIDEVLTKKTGISEMIAIVYGMVAGRLGVICLPEGFPGYFYLKWLERPHLGETEAYTFIDVNHNGDFKSWDDICNSASSCGRNNYRWYKVSKPMKILEEMCLHLIYTMPAFVDGDGTLFMRSVLDLLNVFNPYVPHSQLLKIRTYTELAFLDENFKIHFRRLLDKEVKYAVGMIMRHKMSNKRCVIYAWQIIRNTIEQDTNWQSQPLEICNISYRVLMEGGLKQFAAEEDLEIDHTNEPIYNGEIGKYFESFNGCFYIPNHFMDVVYPEDARVRDRIFGRTDV